MGEAHLVLHDLKGITSSASSTMTLKGPETQDVCIANCIIISTSSNPAPVMWLYSSLQWAEYVSHPNEMLMNMT